MKVSSSSKNATNSEVTRASPRFFVAAAPVRSWSYSTTIAGGWKVWIATEASALRSIFDLIGMVAMTTVMSLLTAVPPPWQSTPRVAWVGTAGRGAFRVRPAGPTGHVRGAGGRCRGTPPPPGRTGEAGTERTHGAEAHTGSRTTRSRP